VDIAQYERWRKPTAIRFRYTPVKLRSTTTGGKAPGLQPYDTFKIDGWAYIGALSGAIYDRVAKFIGLDPVDSFEEC